MKNYPHPETVLFQFIKTQLDDPAYATHPLRESLAALLQMCEDQRTRLERLIRISDGYQSLARSQNLSLIERYDKQIQRLEKLSRISDRYQKHLRELNQELKEAVLRDPLTEIGNRRFLMENLRAESARVLRNGRRYALAILDIDHFKAVNDHLGHEAGDQVLREIARAIQHGLRQYDLCGRWGGEEFLILLPETSLDEALGIAERIRENIAGITLTTSNGAVKVTASLGLALYQPGEIYSETINRADQAMLGAKAAGRNRVRCAELTSAG